jgi:hypothetical protein
MVLTMLSNMVEAHRIVQECLRGRSPELRAAEAAAKAKWDRRNTEFKALLQRLHPEGATPQDVENLAGLLLAAERAKNPLAEKIEAEEYRLVMSGRMDEIMENDVPFITPDGLADLLALTDSGPLDPRHRLPFPQVWLDGKFETEARIFYGLGAVQTGNQVSIHGVFRNKAGEPGCTSIGDALGEASILMEEGGKVKREEARFLASILQNWLLLLEGNQVTQDRAPVPRRIQDMHQRQGFLHPPREYVELRVKDPTLQTALDALRQQRGLGHYSHAFWVRGHWRTLTAERYKEARGKRMWILPYVKGSGLLIEKTYVHQQESVLGNQSPPES